MATEAVAYIQPGVGGPVSVGRCSNALNGVLDSKRSPPSTDLSACDWASAEAPGPAAPGDYRLTKVRSGPAALAAESWRQVELIDKGDFDENQSGSVD
jgi:hypothetical protein